MPNDRKLHTPAYTSTPRLRSLCMTYFVRSGHFVLFVSLCISLKAYISFFYPIQPLLPDLHFVFSVCHGLFRQRWILFVFPSAKTKSRT